ncbi:hypothetical protein HYS48_02015 [Candidatus Woesearchaeota archaeon]|nr:hypothetical protein [Candidatus Woesearchaeota archaeon]
MAELKELKDLTPEERIARLKKLQEEKEKEIEEAKTLLTETFKELEDREEEKLKVPIEQVKAEDESILFTEEEKQIFRMRRFREGKKATETEEGDRPAKQSREHSLDEMVGEERVSKEAAEAAKMPDYHSQIEQVAKKAQAMYQSPATWFSETEKQLRSVQYGSSMEAEEKQRMLYEAESQIHKMEELGLTTYARRLASLAEEIHHTVKYAR